MRAERRRTLVTGMSGTGKSTTVAVLRGRGVDAVDLDDAAWSEHVPDTSPWADPGGAPDWRWRLAAVRELLEQAQGPLVVAGTSTDQGRLYGLLEHVVLLTVPTPVAVQRLRERTTNGYGKAPDELARELALREEVEPLLRAGACLVLDTSTTPPGAVADALVAHALGPACRA